jgi:hypothetical protein
MAVGTGSTKAAIEAARKAADALERTGEHFHAEAVRRLCRSNASLIETCSRLHADNETLRSGK